LSTETLGGDEDCVQCGARKNRRKASQTAVQ
jgi:hypothetical protein